MIIHEAKLRTLTFIRDKVAHRMFRSRQTTDAISGRESGDLSLKSRYLSSLGVVSEIEQDRRSLQEGIASAQQAIDRTFALIARTRCKDGPSIAPAGQFEIMQADSNSHVKDAA
jgi:hypothetical protein